MLFSPRLIRLFKFAAETSVAADDPSSCINLTVLIFRQKDIAISLWKLILGPFFWNLNNLRTYQSNLDL